MECYECGSTDDNAIISKCGECGVFACNGCSNECNGCKKRFCQDHIDVCASYDMHVVCNDCVKIKDDKGFCPDCVKYA